MRVLIFPAALLVAGILPAAADDCSEIVAATVAEMRAGEPDWSDRDEATARRAAGAACVKATTPRAAAAEEAVDAASATTAAAVTADGQGPDETAVSEEQVDDDKAGWKFLGFDVNKVEGSPSQKPYDRKR